MKLQEIVDQLETVPALAGKVSVGIPAMMENVASSPFAWITSVIEQAGNSPVTGPVRQLVDLRVEITVGARNLNDMLEVRDAAAAALINFQPDLTYTPMTFRAGRMEFGDPGWFLWRDEFLTSYYLT
jgi:hypothetical protein